MPDLSGALREALADPGPAEGQIRYFGTPLMVRSGALAGHILTLYRSGRDPDVQELLLRRFETYLDSLRLSGLRVSEMQMRLMDEAGALRPVMLQAPVPQTQSLDHRLRHGDLDTALEDLDRVAANLAEFWRRVAQRPERIGVHAHIGRFAFDADGAPILVDAFLPLIAYSRHDMGRLIHRFADNGHLRGIGKIFPGHARDLQDRWYSQAGSVLTLVDTAMRARPSDCAAILHWAEDVASRRLERSWRAEVAAQLARMARLHAGRRRGWRAALGRDRPHA